MVVCMFSFCRGIKFVVRNVKNLVVVVMVVSRMGLVISDKVCINDLWWDWFLFSFWWNLVIICIVLLIFIYSKSVGMRMIKRLSVKLRSEIIFIV